MFNIEEKEITIKKKELIIKCDRCGDTISKVDVNVSDDYITTQMTQNPPDTGQLDIRIYPNYDGKGLYNKSIYNKANSSFLPDSLKINKICLCESCMKYIYPVILNTVAQLKLAITDPNYMIHVDQDAVHVWDSFDINKNKKGDDNI